MIAWATRVRTAKVSDAAEIAKLHQRSASAGFAHIFEREEMARSREEIASEWEVVIRDRDFEDRRAFVAERAGGIVGVMVAAREPGDPTVGRVSRAYVDERYWSLGVAPLLLEAAVAHLRGLGCDRARMWVMEPNHRARRGVEHLGFRPTGLRQPTCERAATTAPQVEDLEYEGPVATISWSRGHSNDEGRSSQRVEG